MVAYTSRKSAQFATTGSIQSIQRESLANSSTGGSSLSELPIHTLMPHP